MADPIPLRDPFQFPTRQGPPGLNIPVDASTGDTQTTVNIGPDGSVEIVESPLQEESVPDKAFEENLADEDSLAGQLGIIAQELLEGIEADDRARSDWVDNYNEGLDLLGLRIKGSAGNGSATMSTVTHPILLEACLHFRALARGEMLPAIGPAKVRNDGDETPDRTEAADDLEADVNHYLTVTASEYYPDTDRGLMYVAFGGDIFKKVYHCPLRRRPVSECIYLPDLIVSQDATDLLNASRVTHRIEMSRIQVQRLMHAGAYRDISLMGDPAPNPSAIDRKEKEIQGIAAVPQRQQDYQRTIYECLTDLDLSAWVKNPGAPEDLPLPYKVTIDKDSRQILEIRRNWRKDDPLFRKRMPIVKWPFMPAMGFYDMGNLHIIGQHARALTALWRIMIDAGMFANFPGGVKLRGARTDTNQIRPAPGEWVEVDGGAGTDDIRKVLMAMPYKDISSAMLELCKMIEGDARKLAGTVDLEAGEGRTNVPVGTIMAMIEQQTQLITAVHRGLHQAQQEELILLRELFLEDPESLWRDNPQPRRKWKALELQDLSLVPASDPNTPAHIHRVMQGYALAMLSQDNPLFNQYAVQKRLLQTLRIADPEQLLIDPSTRPPPGPDPATQATMEMVKNQAMKNQLDAKAQAAKIMQAREKQQNDFMLKIGDAKRAWETHITQLQNDAADRDSREKIAAMNGQVQLILKGLETLNQSQMTPNPAQDNLVGPG